MTTSEFTTLDQTRHAVAAERPRGARMLGAVAALAAFAWGAYWMTLFRTHWYGGFGEFRDLEVPAVVAYVFVMTILVLPAALVLGFRRALRRWLLMVAAICSASMLFAEAWAGLEEARWRRQAPELAARSSDPGLRWAADGAFLLLPDLSTESVFVHRWWPYDTHTLYYDAQTGLFGGYD